MICWICSGIFRGSRPPLYAPSHIPSFDFQNPDKESEKERLCLRPLHNNISDVARGALFGCQICDIIWRHFCRDKSAPEFLNDPMRHSYFRSGTHYRIRRPDTTFRNDYAPNTLTLEIGLNIPFDKDIPAYKDITLTPTEDEPAIIMEDSPKPDISIYGPQTWSVVENWMSNCKQNHRRCNMDAGQPSRYPTRLLDIEYHESSDPVSQLAALLQFMVGGHLPADCKLIETANTPMTGPYVTLSHRWNSRSGSCVTNRANIAQRKESIKAEELSKTFESAIHFARRLGVRYLWIDSLCIIQNDEDDWKREARSMDSVYAHSVLNLEATVGNGSLLQPRNPRLISPCIIESAWTGFKSIKFVVTDFRYWDTRIYRSVCNTRAWITQERWLAPRVLHFTFDQLLWECRELEAGETFPRGLPKETRSQSSTGFKRHCAKSSSDGSTLTTGESLIADWHKILSTYGRSEVTNENDRLVAIAGITAKLSTSLDDKWLAGLWRKILPGDLLWSVDKVRRTNKPSSQKTALTDHNPTISHTRHMNKSERLKGPRYQAPSWSWASVLGDIIPGIHLEDGSEDSMIDVLDVDLTPVDADMPLGRILSGTLRLRGTLYPMAMDPVDYDPEPAKRSRMPLPPTIYLRGLGKKIKALPGLYLPEELKNNPEYISSVLESHSHVAHLKPDEPVECLDLARSCYLPVRKHIHNNPNSPYHGKRLVAGLALMPTGKRGEYTRLGRMDFTDADCTLFEEGLEVHRKGEEVTGLKVHPPTRDKALYVEEEVGVFTVV